MSRCEKMRPYQMRSARAIHFPSRITTYVIPSVQLMERYL